MAEGYDRNKRIALKPNQTHEAQQKFYKQMLDPDLIDEFKTAVKISGNRTSDRL